MKNYNAIQLTSLALADNLAQYTQRESEHQLDQDANFEMSLVADGWQDGFVRGRHPNGGVTLVRPQSNGSIKNGSIFTARSSGNGARPQGTWLNS